jgi:hypothetical protein
VDRTFLTVLNLGTAVCCRYRGAGVSILRTVDAVWDARTAVPRYPAGQVEPVAGAAPTVGVGDSVESDQTGRAERCDGTAAVSLVIPIEEAISLTPNGAAQPW